LARLADRDVLVAYVNVQKAADAEVKRLLTDAYRDINRQLRLIEASDNTSAALLRMRLLATKREILERQAELYDKIGDVVQRRRKAAAARAIQVAGRYDQDVFNAIGETELGREVSRNFEQTELRSIDAAIARMTKSRTSLSTRVYRARAWADERLERRINSALARGLSADQLAAEIRDFINPRTPGGQRYAALRLARTEINNAFHAMSIQAAIDKPWIDKVEWHLSRSHPRPDECDALAGRMFAPEDTPPKPHPQCLCYITPVVDMSAESDEAFLDRLVEGDFDDFLKSFGVEHGL
jgi:SPP1 gp7 family putative phage head morphogenesis protein